MKLKVNEIFYSIQGEGLYAGTPMVFLRLSGCNLSCPFCDTKHQEFTEMSLDDILIEITKYPCTILLVTGGEPTLQWTRECYDYFKAAGYRVHIETNGTSPLVYADFISVSPKGQPGLSFADEIKLVWEGDFRPTTIDAPIKYLMPRDNDRTLIDSAIDFCKSNKGWRLCYRIHQALNLR